MLDEQLRELALLEPTDVPCLSLYLNTQADQHGKDNFDAFVRKQLDSAAGAFEQRSPQRDSFDKDAEKIDEWLRTELDPSSNGAALLACAGAAEFFEALQFDAPIQHNSFHVSPIPHLYPLARLNSEYPSYAAVLADTNSARLFVFGLARVLETETVGSTKVRSRTQVGGWSQARYQRHVGNYHLHHTKEVIEQLEKLTSGANKGIDYIIFAGDQVILPLLRENLSKFLAEDLIGSLKLDIDTPEHEVLQATQALAREHHTTVLQQQVSELLENAAAAGLASARLDGVVTALVNGQVDTLFLDPSIEQLDPGKGRIRKVLATLIPDATFDDPTGIDLAGALVTAAYRTSASARVVADEALSAAGGVGATLRYRV
jgi:peptide chain release factor subunit 1